MYLNASFSNWNVPVFLVHKKETSATLIGYPNQAKLPFF